MKPEDKRNLRKYGLQYEDIASDYLIQKGYRLLAKNISYKWGEIDLILEQGEGRETVLVFVEVRKRASGGMISAVESVTYRKERRLRSAIESYLLRYRGKAQSLRIDLIAFHDEEIRHLKSFIA